MSDLTPKVVIISVDETQKVHCDSPIIPHSVAAIGSFDGVHLGHQSVITKAKEIATAKSKPLSLICFDPHPQTFLHPNSQKFRLMTLNQQIKAFSTLGVAQVIVLKFDTNLSHLTPDVFAHVLLQHSLKLSDIICGFDFSFGFKGQGKAKDLGLFGDIMGFKSHIVGCQNDPSGTKWSSSAVREALISGHCDRAKDILGRYQAYEGEIIIGRQQGRLLGFATLNIDLEDYQRPQYGVYVTQTRLMDERLLPSITNIGLRPTVDGALERMETHIFDFNEDIYGQMAEVSLMHFIRPEKAFSSLEALKTQISYDCDIARAFHKL